MDKYNKRTGPWDYIDFELEIRKGARRKYPVCVRSPEGEAQGEMRFPFAKGELQDKLRDLENAVLLSGRRRRRIRTPEAQSVQDFGQALFRALLHDELRTHYDLSLREARRQNKGLRLKLHIQPPELTVLPWEFLYDPGRDAYLSLSSKTPLVRYIELPEPVERLPVTPPLRILGMVASPCDLDPLDVEHEKRRVEEGIEELQAQGRVELTWLEGHTPRDLQRALAVSGPWHIFHFIGHGGFDQVSDEGLIALADKEGYARFLRAEDLAQLLKDHWDLRLVLLNSCEGARGSEHDAFSSTAASLVRPGIPAVLANQYEITDEAAIEFSRTFYQAVADGLPVDAAVAYARTSLKIEIDNTLEWATPVLYMRSPDGSIFDISSEAPPVKPSQGETREEALRRYREGVKSILADGELNRREAEWLRDLANKLELSPSAAADVEREVMGDTVEAILEQQERAAQEEHHEARPGMKETKGDSKQSAKFGGKAQIDPAIAEASPRAEERKPKREQNAEPVGEAEPVKATPAAHRCAEELGVDLREVKGTGTGGRITVVDVKKTAAEARQDTKLNEADRGYAELEQQSPEGHRPGQEGNEVSRVSEESRSGNGPKPSSFQRFLPHGKRMILSATAVGILLILLTGGGAMALTGVDPVASLLRGPESQPVGENPSNQPSDNRQGTAAGGENTEKTTSPVSGDSPAPKDMAPRGEVGGQDAAAGAKAEPDASKKGSSADSTPKQVNPPVIKVPDVVGKKVEEAKQTISKAGLKYTLKTVESNKPAGTVVSTDPPAGQSVDPSKEVTITQSAPGPHPPPSPGPTTMSESSGGPKSPSGAGRHPGSSPPSEDGPSSEPLPPSKASDGEED